MATDWVDPPSKNFNDSFGKQTYDILKNDLNHLHEQIAKLEALKWATLYQS